MHIVHKILIVSTIILIAFGIKLGSDSYLNAMQLMVFFAAVLFMIIIATDGIPILLVPKVFRPFQLLGWSSATVAYLALHSREGNATASCIMMLTGAYLVIYLFKKI